MGITDFQAVADFSKLSKVDAVPIDVTAKKYSDQLDITLGTTNTMKIKKDEVVTISVPVNITVKEIQRKDMLLVELQVRRI